MLLQLPAGLLSVLWALLLTFDPEYALRGFWGQSKARELGFRGRSFLGGCSGAAWGTGVGAAEAAATDVGAAGVGGAVRIVEAAEVYEGRSG